MPTPSYYQLLVSAIALAKRIMMIPADDGGGWCPSLSPPDVRRLMPLVIDAACELADMHERTTGDRLTDTEWMRALAKYIREGDQP